MSAIDDIKGLTAEVRFQSKDCYAFAEAAARLMENEHLDTLLFELSKYGEPRVSKHSKGWHSAIEMYVSSVGASFKVSSEFDHKTPTEAARVCLDRVETALSGLGA